MNRAPRAEAHNMFKIWFELVLCAGFNLYFLQSSVYVMCSRESALCAVFSLCHVQSSVCVMCSRESVLSSRYSHEPRRFAPSMLRFARVAGFACFWVQHQYMTESRDLPTKLPSLRNNLLTNKCLPHIYSDMIYLTWIMTCWFDAVTEIAWLH